MLSQLTARGIEAKAKISARFLQRKLGEYEALKAEIEQLQFELGDATVRSKR